MKRLNLPQRVVLVMSWGIVLLVLGGYIMTIGTPRGWTAYAPLSNRQPSLGLATWLRVLVWLGLTPTFR